MTGTQALAAVLQPGRKLVTEEVAAAIVRFVAGGAELANAEVEPSLLSLICRELNDARLAQGSSEISLDLLAGSHATILSNFYERALADQPPAVRRIIEDELLTTRDIAKTSPRSVCRAASRTAGAAPGTLAVLVNRRLLRIEERLDVRRVELTHDVLCGVVKASRDERHEREAREATERPLAAQRERELAARRALVRARQIATACIVLALGAVLAAGFAIFNSQRAQRAEELAEKTRAESEQARAGAEHLLGYLTDDFVRELESFGQLNVVAEFAKRQIDYFHSLPADLKGPETTRNGALAMTHYARAMRILGNLNEGSRNADEAIGLLEQLRTGGDASEGTAIALALACATRGAIYDNQNDSKGVEYSKRSEEILRPFAEAPKASLAARRAYMEVLGRRGFEQQSNNQNEDAVRTEERAMQLAASMGALDLSDANAAASYAEAGGWRVTALQNLGRNDEARRIGESTDAIAVKVLERRPGYRLALHARQIINGTLAGVALNDLDPRESQRYALKNVQVSEELLNLDPNSTVAANNLGVARQNVGDSYWYAGQLNEAIPDYLAMLDDFEKAIVGGANQTILYGYQNYVSVDPQARLGRFADAQATADKAPPYLRKLRETEPAGSMVIPIYDSLTKSSAADIAYYRDDYAAARKIAGAAAEELRGIDPKTGFQEIQKFGSLFTASDIAGHAAYLLGDYAAAEAYQREAVDARQKFLTDAVSDRRDIAEKSTWLAMALARQGKFDEAGKVIAPVVKFQRELSAKNRGDRWQPLELAYALYAQALSDKTHGAALLHEAAALLDAAPASIKAMHEYRQWRERIAKAGSVGG